LKSGTLEILQLWAIFSHKNLLYESHSLYFGHQDAKFCQEKNTASYGSACAYMALIAQLKVGSSQNGQIVLLTSFKKNEANLQHKWFPPKEHLHLSDSMQWETSSIIVALERFHPSS